MILGFMSRLSGAFVAAFWGLHLGAILRASLVVSGASRRRLRDVFGGVLSLSQRLGVHLGGLRPAIEWGGAPEL